MSVNTTKYLNEIASGFQQAIDEVKSLCEALDEETLNRPEGPNQWSMLQCVEHISLANELYVNNIGIKLKTSSLPVADEQYRGHWKGHMFAKMNAPKPGDKIGMKVKTFKSMEPEFKLDKATILQRFSETHENLLATVDNTRSVNIDKIKVATALGAMVKLRIGEAYRFILAHTQRHLVQLRRIKNTVTA